MRALPDRRAACWRQRRSGALALHAGRALCQELSALHLKSSSVKPICLPCNFLQWPKRSATIPAAPSGPAPPHPALCFQPRRSRRRSAPGRRRAGCAKAAGVPARRYLMEKLRFQ